MENGDFYQYFLKVIFKYHLFYIFKTTAMAELRTGRKTPKISTVIERTGTTTKGNGELPHPTTFNLQYTYDQTKETTTQRSSASIESLLSSPLISQYTLISILHRLENVQQNLRCCQTQLKNTNEIH